jgi:hypothetical protein
MSLHRHLEINTPRLICMARRINTPRALSIPGWGDGARHTLYNLWVSCGNPSEFTGRTTRL